MPKTIVSTINWKKSFLSHPFIVIEALKPIPYRITIKEVTDDGVMTILPALEGTIDEVFAVLEGCLSDESNFATVLQEYYGKINLKEIKFDFNGIPGSITHEMTAFDAKVEWIKSGILSGYKNFVRCLTEKEKRALSRYPEIKAQIESFHDEL